MKQLDEQRYLWLLRAFIIFLIISVFLNLILYMSFDKISPQPKREVFFINAENIDADIIYVTDINTNNRLAISQNSPGGEIAKDYISSYVINRESVYSNVQAMENLWGKNSMLAFFSSPAVYQDFLKSSEYAYGISGLSGTVSSAKIANIVYQTQSKQWDVSVIIQTTDVNGLNPRLVTKNIIVKGDFMKEPLKRNSKNKWENPLAFLITEYKYK